MTTSLNTPTYCYRSCLQYPLSCQCTAECMGCMYWISVCQFEIDYKTEKKNLSPLYQLSLLLMPNTDSKLTMTLLGLSIKGHQWWEAQLKLKCLLLGPKNQKLPKAVQGPIDFQMFIFFWLFHSLMNCLFDAHLPQSDLFV